MKTDSVKIIKDITIQAELILKAKGRLKEIDTINAYLKSVDNRETNVLICGEFKRGKSSFINAFLEQEICPVDIDIATAAVSIIKYGDKERVTRQFGDIHNLQTEVYDSLDAISQFASGVSVDNTALLVIEIPNEKLEGGLVLIDTPGVGGLDPRHAFLTNYFLPKANIVLFITDKDQPITAAEIDFFNNKIVPFAKQKALIINKADLLKDSDETNRWIEDGKKKCSVEGSPLKVVAVSSRLKKRFLAKGKQKDYDGSNFREVEEMISSLVDSYKRGLLLELREFIVSIFEELITPIRIQVDQIKEPNPELISKLKEEVEEYKSLKADLESPSSEYRRKINTIITNAKTNVDARINTESIKMSTILEALLKRSELRNNLPLLESHLENHLAQIVSEIDMYMEPAFNQVRATLGLDIDLSDHSDLYIPNIIISSVDKSFTQQATNTVKAGMTGVGLAFILGAFTGGIGLIPSLAGALFGGVNLHNMNAGETISTLRGDIMPQLQVSISEIKASVQTRFNDFNDQLIVALQESNRNIIENMSSAIADLNTLERQSAEQKRKKAKLLTDELKPMEQILATTKLFMSNRFGKSSEAAAPSKPKEGTYTSDKTIY